MEREGVSCMGGGVRLLLYGLLLVGLGWAVFELTKHLGEVREGETESRLVTWNRLEKQVRNRRNNDGYRYYAASCMFSKVRSEGSVRFGEPNPHFKLAACKSSVCDYAIIGVLYDDPAAVTARAGVPEKTYMMEVRKDACLNFDVAQLMAIIDGRMEP